MIMKTIIVHAEVEKIEKITAFLRELQVSFETAEEISTYNSDFIEKIKNSQKQYKEGKFKTVAKEDLEAYLKS